MSMNSQIMSLDLTLRTRHDAKDNYAFTFDCNHHICIRIGDRIAEAEVIHYHLNTRGASEITPGLQAATVKNPEPRMW